MDLSGFGTQYSDQIPDDQKKQMLYNTLLQMGAKMLQPGQGPRSFLGDLSGAMAGGATSLNDQMAQRSNMARQQILDTLLQNKNTADIAHLGAQTGLANAQADVARNPKNTIAEQLSIMRYGDEKLKDSQYPQRVSDFMSAL